MKNAQSVKQSRSGKFELSREFENFIAIIWRTFLCEIPTPIFSLNI